MRRPQIFAVLAGIAAALAAIIVFSALKRSEVEVQQAIVNTVQIVVAAHDLALGSRIDASSVKLARWSRDSVPPGAFTDPQALVNSFVKSEILVNEPVVADQLFMGRKIAGVMQLLIPDGMRAMSVQVDEVSDIAGFVQPRSHVDVLVSVSGSGRDIPSFSKVVLQDIEVLAVAQQVEKKNDQPEEVKVVTLLVTPRQAEKLALASHEGQLRLALRNFNDRRFVMTGGAEMADLHGFKAPVPHTQISAAPLRLRREIEQPLSVKIMRDGRSAESVSFIKAARAERPMGFTRLAPATADDPALAARSAAASASPPDATMTSAGHASASMMAAPVLAGALAPAPMEVAPAAPLSAPAADTSGYQPAPKTIAIP